MKIEKLTENKIRVIVNSEDLKNNNLDYKTIMEKPIESQKLFLEMLLKAEKEVGFYTEGYRLLVEAFSSSDGLFVFTITKYAEKATTSSNKLKVTPKKKTKHVNPKSSTSIYKFSSFEEFCEFCTAMHNITNFQSKQLAKTIALYLFNDTYYLILSNINTESAYIHTFYSTISEFASLASHSETFKMKLLEHGKAIMKRNAIETGIKYFLS